MKEATGELNSTLIVVVAVAALAAFFFTVIWPMYRENYKRDERCSNAICDAGYNTNGGFAYCFTPGKPSNVFECPFKG